MPNAALDILEEGLMTARTFRCRECGYPFKTAEQGWARDAALMCPACGSTDVSIEEPPAQPAPVRMTARERATGSVTPSGTPAALARADGRDPT